MDTGFSLAPSEHGIISTNTVFVAKRLVFPETEIVPRASPEAEMANLVNSGHLEVIRRVKPSPPPSAGSFAMLTQPVMDYMKLSVPKSA